MKNDKNTRSLKVYTRFNNTATKISQKVPEIRLKGNWLKSWGFDSGKNINVVKTKFGLIIKDKDFTPPTITL